MKYKVTLNSRVYEVEVEEHAAMLVDEYELAAPEVPATAVSVAPASLAVPAAPAPASATTPIAAGEVVESPMPGNILKINVAQGQTVKEGDVLIVLEAMKMENEITAPRGGVIAQIIAAKGAVVETGSPLVVLA